jgi:hypothetical protein
LEFTFHSLDDGILARAVGLPIILSELQTFQQEYEKGRVSFAIDAVDELVEAHLRRECIARLAVG